MTLVVDANVVVGACLAPDGFDVFLGDELVAPPLMWSEFLNALRGGRWRGEVSEALAFAALRAADGAPVKVKNHRRLRKEAWHIADELGWAKTYDAEYLALGAILGAPVVTLDMRLRRGAYRVADVMTPDEYMKRASR